MHIGIDARFIQGPNTGVTNYVINLLKGISRVDKNNTYSIFISDPNFNGKIPAAANFCIRTNSVNALIWKNLWLPKEIKKLRVDLMHFPAYTGSFVNVGTNIVTIPDVIHKINPRWFSRKELFLINLPIKLAIKNANHIIAISENTKNDIIKNYNVPPEKITVTFLAADGSYRPISDISMKERIKKKYGIDDDFILNIGVLFKRRNIIRLLEAFSLLKKDKNIRCKLVIAGPGMGYFNLDAYIKKYGLKGSVIYLGYVEQADMPLLYNSASFFVYPSLYEGFGLPVLEAMSCAKAVITSRVSSLPEVAGDAGMLIDPYNTNELYAAMYKLAKDSLLRDRLGSKALERAKIFNWDNLAEQTVTLYEKIYQDSKR